MQERLALCGGGTLAHDQGVVLPGAVLGGDLHTDGHGLGGIPEVDGVAVVAAVGGGDGNGAVLRCPVNIFHRHYTDGGIPVGGLRPDVLKGAAAAHGVEAVEVLLGSKCGGQRLEAAVAVGFVQMQQGQGGVAARFPDGDGVGARVGALGDGEGGRGIAVGQRHGGGSAAAIETDAAAVTGSGGKRDAPGALGHHQLVAHTARGKGAVPLARVGGQCGQVRLVFGKGKDTAAVVAVVNGAVGAADGADKAKLLMTGRIVDLRFHGVCAGAVGGIHGDEGHAAGLAVIGGVAVEPAGLGQIGRGDHHRALGIGQQGHGIQTLQSVGIGHDEVAGAVAVGDDAAAGTEEHLISVYHRGGGGLGGHLAALQVGQGAGGGVHRGGGDVTVLGGEIHPALFGAVRHRGALVAHAGEGEIGDHIARGLIQGQQVGIADKAVGTVVGTHDDGIAHHGGACPVKAAGDGLFPHKTAVGGIDADEVGVLGLAVPKAGVQIAVGVGDGGVVLALQLVGEHPPGLQSPGVKGLDLAAGQGAENSSVRIGGGDDHIAAAGGHGGLAQQITGLQIHLFQGGHIHKNEGVVGDDKGAGAVLPAAAEGFRPFFHGGLR